MKKFIFLVTAAILNGCRTQFWKGPTPAKFALIWFSGFRGEDLNVIFYQNMPNLHNRYKLAERQISQKNPEYMLIYSLPCSCSKYLSSFRFIFYYDVSNTVHMLILNNSIFSASAEHNKSGCSNVTPAVKLPRRPSVNKQNTGI